VADIKWIKITSYMFEDEKIRLIDAMPNGVLVIYVWLRLLVQAGKINANGYIYLTENIPYTEEMLSTLFCKPLESIKFALKTLCDFQMIEVDSNNIIKIVNWDKHQNIEGMERVRAQNRKRAENHREKKKQIEETTKEKNEEEKQNTDQVNVQDDNEESSKVNKEDCGNYIENTNDSLSNNINDDSSEITNNSCNVTKNKSNVTVTEQNKSKSKKENKNKKEIESEDNNIADEINNRGSTHDEEVKESSLSQSEDQGNPIAIAEDINAKAVEIMTYYEKITGVIGGINYGALRLAIDMHGAESVKMAINKALEVNQTDMRYINGILKNWRREGYPNQREEVKNGTRSTGKSNAADKNEFTGFKPKKPRNLTESERKEAEEKLI
jgi:predicted phage replisome organizer